MALLTERGRQTDPRDGAPFQRHANEPNFRYEVSDEIGDILWALVNVANQTGVDLTYR